MMLATLSCAVLVAGPGPRPTKRYVMAHYMPWYEAKPVAKEWGWHWTMGRLDPDRVENGRRQAASHYRPLIGLYDSGDVQALEYHALLMKFAGIDGVMVDWYGNVEHFDYGVIHRNTRRMFEVAKRAGLRFAVVYEDQTVPQLIKGGKFTKEEAVGRGRELMRWAHEHWFRSPTYLTQNGRPLLLVFGPQYYQPQDWERMFEGLSPSPAFFTLHHRRGPAVGAYDWPLPKGGTEGSARERDAFYARAKEWPAFIPAAYPRFHDFYKEAGVHESWGSIEDLGGKTYERTLTKAFESDAEIVQLATWNDWGEGTMIEPSLEFGYRDLEATQRLRRRFLGGSLRYTPGDLRLPVRLYLLQKRHQGDQATRAKLATVSRLLFDGQLARARKMLDALKPPRT